MRSSRERIEERSVFGGFYEAERSSYSRIHVCSWTASCPDDEFEDDACMLANGENVM
jgi:hypothetical protein